MSKGKKRCYFCGCNLTNQNKNSTIKRGAEYTGRDLIWLDCCHVCKYKEDKKHQRRL